MHNTYTASASRMISLHDAYKKDSFTWIIGIASIFKQSSDDVHYTHGLAAYHGEVLSALSLLNSQEDRHCHIARIQIASADGLLLYETHQIFLISTKHRPST